MADTADQTHGYESPRIEARAAIDGALIGGAVSGNEDVFDSATFTHI
jgi:hypothetical protein